MRPRSFNLQRQDGAALVVGLILLLILTVLGVSGLGTATTEVRLADNTKQREYAFQSAESAVSADLARGGVLVIGGDEVENDILRTRNYTYAHRDAEGSVADANVGVQVATHYRGRGNPPNGYEIGRFQSVHFVSHSAATAARGARSSVRQGFLIPAPTP